MWRSLVKQTDVSGPALRDNQKSEQGKTPFILANISQVFNRILFTVVSVIVFCCTTNHLKTHCLIISWCLCSMWWKGLNCTGIPQFTHLISGVDWKLGLNWNLRGLGSSLLQTFSGVTMAHTCDLSLWPWGKLGILHCASGLPKSQKCQLPKSRPLSPQNWHDVNSAHLFTPVSHAASLDSVLTGATQGPRYREVRITGGNFGH